jgi:predicted RNA-binding protein
MAYFVDLFSPQTYEAFTRSNRAVSGFRLRQENAASKIKKGDKLICYMTKMSRWCGVLEVVSGSFVDETPIFYEENDPFVVRFEVKPLAWLDKEKAIPIREEGVFDRLSFTKGYDKKSSSWTGRLRSSLTQIDEKDGRFLEQLILAQLKGGQVHPIDEREYERWTTHKVRRPDKPEVEVTVSIPENTEAQDTKVPTPQADVRESIKIQAMLANIGAKMGMRIWLPRNDRSAVLTEWKVEGNQLLNVLPLNYDALTIKTIEQIDVLWLKGRSIVRAFEVEHTTSIYSGILRMADLLALQPNMDIKLHIVAPSERRGKVFEEIQRPVFSLLEKGPLAESCSYLSYESVKKLSKEQHLKHLSDSVLEDYAEYAEEAG